ncbi:hypothetical protein EYS14_18790 [Alteromonadaceae bacterium M269]|nr:hypothetical protein EYS14_18790 [Alteromonadaceae bacterium M269]
MKITIIYTEEEMLISIVNYQSWREIQDKYERFEASLGPWSIQEAISYLNDEYINLSPKAETQISNLLKGSQDKMKLTFNDQ